MPLDKAIIQQITTNSITTLDLYTKQIGDAEIKELAEALKINQSITNLNFGQNQIRDAGAKYIAEALKTNQSITNLSFWNNQIGDAGMQTLAEALKINQSITSLYLFYNQIGDAGVQTLAEALKINQSITNLSLHSNQIGDAGVQTLAETLKDNKSITTLDLNRNQIGDAGAKYIAEALKINQSITTLNLHYNQIGNVVAKEIETELQINRDPTKKAAKILKQQQQAEADEKARQEAERLEQEAKLREQEETKATEEAANGANEALAYYVKAIKANSHLPKIYEELGQLFFNNGEYVKAIDCYKVINNEFRIEACFKAWLKQDQDNPNIKLKQAEYFKSVGLFEKAKKCYHHAFSLSQDEDFKAAALEKIGNIMVNAADQGQDFITRAYKHDFYNYDLVDDTFINNLLGDCDL